MKKQQNKPKLSLSKETISRLNTLKLNEIIGGATPVTSQTYTRDVKCIQQTSNSGTASSGGNNGTTIY